MPDFQNGRHETPSLPILPATSGSSHSLDLKPLDGEKTRGIERDETVEPRDTTPTRLSKLAVSVWHAHRFEDTPQWISGKPDPALDWVEGDPSMLPLRYGLVVQSPLSIAKESGNDIRSSDMRRSVVPFPIETRVNLDAMTRNPKVMPQSPEGLVPFKMPSRRPPVAIFSLAGGTGRSTIAACMARFFSACGERVLLADTCRHSLLPLQFGGSGSRQGTVRRFRPLTPGTSNETISLLSVAADAFAGNEAEQDRILEEFLVEASKLDRVVWDLGGASLAWTTKVLARVRHLIVPLLPSPHSMVQIDATERFLEKCAQRGSVMGWKYILNQMDERNPMHVEMRTRLRTKIGDKLLPMTLRASPLVDEALERGKTIIDHAPACLLVEDLWRLTQRVAEPKGRARSSLPFAAPSLWMEQ